MAPMPRRGAGNVETGDVEAGDVEAECGGMRRSASHPVRSAHGDERSPMSALPISAPRWAAVDVETADHSPASICALGVAFELGDGTTGSRSWLVHPPGNRYEPQFSELHGLTAEDTDNAPYFPAVWEEAREAIADANLLAHYAEFDTECIAAALRHHGRSEPDLKPVGCTLRMAHLALPNRSESYSLSTLCADFGIPHRPHDAASDAAAALALARLLEAAWSGGDLQQLREASDHGYSERAASARRRARHR